MAGTEWRERLGKALLDITERTREIAHSTSTAGTKLLRFDLESTASRLIGLAKQLREIEAEEKRGEAGDE